ncbi:MAG: hypothetical protein A2X25_14465 [Chloroflexi bacterium GWB2_49_20]|nr:MAG: hypothetical protein A2X25_14465 [Chloroflexi bacterium GWB2_49_20]OGN77282.1 MAG: hypothetical protein A2X26_08780 [Chloroflexi bacterium GWC2_49_37]OGN84721.1 MAG: hypothetical protein A2X27_15325 [Chloroflexi bacterium GWD2_49_16]HBG75116.1 hypothetical protein [Anaerolineae bacterium]HCC78467.1 hypothetical protein [Anaerolineae bacterium]
MSAIAAYRTKILALLDDPTIQRFTSAQIDAALVYAVEEYSRCKPLVRSYSLDSTGAQRITLPADFSSFSIVRVEWVRDDFHTDEVPFYTYMQDEQWILETCNVTIPLGEVLALTYYCMHTIDGLASAAGTTIPDTDEDLVVLGAAGEAARSRAISKTESNNLNPAEAEQLTAFALSMLHKFERSLGRYETGYQTASWNDTSIDKAY